MPDRNNYQPSHDRAKKSFLGSSRTQYLQNNGAQIKDFDDYDFRIGLKKGSGSKHRGYLMGSTKKESANTIQKTPSKTLKDLDSKKGLETRSVKFLN